MKRQRRRFTPEFKAKVVLEILAGTQSPAEACRKHALGSNLLGLWKSSFLERAHTLFQPDERRDEDQARIAELEHEPVAISVDEALAAELEGATSAEQAAERRECDGWLRDTLAVGPVLISEIWRDGKEAGFSRDALKRAKSRIGASSAREGFGPGSKLYWRLGDANTDEVDQTIERT